MSEQLLLGARSNLLLFHWLLTALQFLSAEGGPWALHILAQQVLKCVSVNTGAVQTARLGLGLFPPLLAEGKKKWGSREEKRIS